MTWLLLAAIPTAFFAGLLTASALNNARWIEKCRRCSAAVALTRLVRP